MVDVEHMVAIEVSRYGVTPEMIDFDCMVIMHTKVKICIMWQDGGYQYWDN
jgi:hypothetical protein